MSEVDNRNFVQVKVHIPAELYRKVHDWMYGVFDEDREDIEKFIELAWDTVPWAWAAYEEYLSNWDEVEAIDPLVHKAKGMVRMSLDEFTHSEMGKWFK